MRSVILLICIKLFNSNYIGEKGDEGYIGLQGITGPQGQKGDMGYPGRRGENGDFGLQGEIGNDGRPGNWKKKLSKYWITKLF